MALGRLKIFCALRRGVVESRMQVIETPEGDWFLADHVLGCSTAKETEFAEPMTAVLLASGHTIYTNETRERIMRQVHECAAAAGRRP